MPTTENTAPSAPETNLHDAYLQTQQQVSELLKKITALTTSFDMDKQSLQNELRAELEKFKKELESFYNEKIAALDKENLGKLENLQNLKAEFESFCETLRQSFTTQITQKSEEFQKSINEKLNEITQRFSELEKLAQDKSELEALIKGSKADFESLKQAFATDVSTNINDFRKEVEKAKLEFFNEQGSLKDESLKELKEFGETLTKKFQAMAESLETLSFVSKTEPLIAKLGDTWLDTSTGLVKVYQKNEQVRFFSADEPSDFARLYDTLYNEKDDSFYMFLSTKNGNEWLASEQDVLKATFQQKTKPENSDTLTLKANETWFEMDFLEVYYRENNAWVQISKKLEQARFIQDTEPSAAQNIKLNDIWKKGEDFYMRVSVSENAQVVEKWLALEDVYQYAKFKQLDEPVSVENKISVNMFDLWFKHDKSKLYVYEKTAQNDKGEAVFDWVLLSEAKKNARFKAQALPNELMQDDLWFKHEADDELKGELMIYTPASFKYEWLSAQAMQKYAKFKQESEPKPENASVADIWYKPFSKEFLVFVEEANVREFRQIDLNASTYTQDSEPEVSKVKAGQSWVNPSLNNEKLYYTKLLNTGAWQKSTDEKLKAYEWVNENDTRLDTIEALISPDTSLKEASKSIIELKYPQQFVQNYHFSVLNEKMQGIEEKFSTTNEPKKDSDLVNLKTLNSKVANEINNTQTQLTQQINNTQTQLTQQINNTQTQLTQQINNTKNLINQVNASLASKQAAINSVTFSGIATKTIYINGRAYGSFQDIYSKGGTSSGSNTSDNKNNNAG